MAEFYKCNSCDQIIAVVNKGAGTLVCCGQDMEKLVAGKIDASHEKHVPFVNVKGHEVEVRVGTADHPMEDAHYIQWICLKTDRGLQLKYLKPGQSPKALFYLEPGEKVSVVYAYCNIHGLWSVDLT